VFNWDIMERFLKPYFELISESDQEGYIFYIHLDTSLCCYDNADVRQSVDTDIQKFFALRLSDVALQLMFLENLNHPGLNTMSYIDNIRACPEAISLDLRVVPVLYKDAMKKFCTEYLYRCEHRQQPSFDEALDMFYSNLAKSVRSDRTGLSLQGVITIIGRFWVEQLTFEDVGNIASIIDNVTKIIATPVDIQFVTTTPSLIFGRIRDRIAQYLFDKFYDLIADSAIHFGRRVSVPGLGRTKDITEYIRGEQDGRVAEALSS